MIYFQESEITVSYDNNGSASGYPNSLIPAGINSSILVLTDSDGTITHRIDIYKIAFITLPQGYYFVNPDRTLKIRFLDTLSSIPTGSIAENEAAIRNTFNSLIGSPIIINVTAGGNDTNTQIVKFTAYGATLLDNNVIVSNIHVEDIK